MKPVIKLLLLQIMQLAAQLATNNRYLVFLDLSGHVSVVAVRIYEQTAEWNTGKNPQPIAIARAYYDISGWEWLTEEEQEHLLESELKFMHAALHGYLPAAIANATEVLEAA